MSEFNIGDRVIVDYNKKKGTIVKVEESEENVEKSDYVINFDENINGWKDEELGIESGHGWWVGEYRLTKLNKVEDNIVKTLKVRYIDKSLTKMEKIEKGDLVDLRASKIFVNGKEEMFPCTYKFGDTVFVKLGFAMEMPQGYKANVYPRSGTFKNYGLILTNSVGQIDNSYNGSEDQWGGMFYATREGVMNYDDRILQFEVVPQAMNDVIFDFVEELGDANRGGYSSTGVK